MRARLVAAAAFLLAIGSAIVLASVRCGEPVQRDIPDPVPVSNWPTAPPVGP